MGFFGRKGKGEEGRGEGSVVRCRLPWSGGAGVLFVLKEEIWKVVFWCWDGWRWRGDEGSTIRLVLLKTFLLVGSRLTIFF